MLGDTAPNFTTDSSIGPLTLYDWQGPNWVVFFSHPADDTPVCTTELGAVAKYAPEFAKRSVKTIGLSCDGVQSHLKWIKDIEMVNSVKVEFPIVADPDRTVARLYGMLGYQDDTPKVRAC